MGSFTDYFEKKILNAIGGQDTLPSLTTYLALFTAAPSDASGGTEIGAGVNYARVNFANWASTTSNFSGGTTVMFSSNTATFATATGSWGTASCFAVFDALAAGNMLFWATLTAAKTIGTADIAVFGTGSLTVSLD